MVGTTIEQRFSVDETSEYPSPEIKTTNSEKETAELAKREVWLGNIYLGYQGIGKVRRLDGSEGFSYGWSYPPEHDLFSDQANKGNVALIEQVAKQLMTKKGWDGIDVLIGCSISARSTVPHEVTDRLRAQGYQIGESKDYSEACLGGQAAVADVLMNPKYYGKRVAVIPYEFLSGNAMGQTDEYKSTRDMFGNGVAWMAFTAGIDIECKYANVKVQPDRPGVIRVPKDEQIGQDEEKLTPPWYYHFINAETGQEMPADFDWSTQEYFMWTEKGAYLDMPPTGESGVTEVNGKKTIYLFSEDGSLYIAEAEDDYEQYLKQMYGEIGARWMHQPSITVVKGLERKMRIRTWAKYGVTEAQARMISKMTTDEQKVYLKEKGIPDIELPWVMKESLVNNVSGATSFVELVEMVRQGKIQFEKLIPGHGFAIGALFGNYYFIFHDEQHAEMRQLLQAYLLQAAAEGIAADSESAA